MSEKRCFCFTCMKPVNLDGMVCEECFSSAWQCFDEADKDRLRAWLSSEKCTWHKGSDERNIYEADCGNVFEITEGTPKENEMTYCPYCGKVIIES